MNEAKSNDTISMTPCSHTRNTGNQKRPRIRAPMACSHCNAAKKLCDVAIKNIPCTRCLTKGLDGCAIVESKRGRYDRKAKKAAAVSNAVPRAMPNAASGNITGAESNHLDKTIEVPPSEVVSTKETTSDEHNNDWHDWHNSGTMSESSNDALSIDDESWELIFETFLDSARCFADKNSIEYFGESSPVSMLLKGLKKRGEMRLRHPNLLAFNYDLGGDIHPKHVTREKLAYLNSQKCFSLPRQSILQRLVAIYFESVHPIYPIINKEEFMGHLKENKVSWILIHSVCFAASRHCPGLLIHESGYSNRKEASFEFYKRAKSIFDFSYEKRKSILLQSTTILSLWGGKPNDYWNTFSWINIAVNIAESLGMHKRIAFPEITETDKQLWKRTWWCLVTKDAFCASLLGKPLRVNISQCDTEMLTLADFDVDSSGNITSTMEALYLIEMTKLGLVLRRMVSLKLSSSQIDTLVLRDIYFELQQLKDNISTELKFDSCVSSSQMYIYAASLRLVYLHHIIYLYQMVSTSYEEISAELYEQVELAVVTIIEIGSTLITKELIRLLPQEPFAGFFLASVILLGKIKNTTSPSDSALAHSQLRNCEMVIHGSQDYWDHSTWILPLCQSLRQRIEDWKTKQQQNQNELQSTDTFNGSNVALSPILNYINIFDTDLLFNSYFPGTNDTFEFE